MKFIKLIFAFTLAHAICSCGAKDASANEAERVEKEIATGNSAINPLDYSDLIKRYIQISYLRLTQPQKYMPTLNAISRQMP